jgi:aryl-alcohol dehydrogenase-like predicted oxidoreductase
MYGDSEALLGKWFAANPDKRKNIFLATKFGIVLDPTGGHNFAVDGTPEYMRESLEASLKHMNVPYVDLFYMHRISKSTPIEKTIEAMVELKNEGKIKYLGLSECSADTLRRAHAVHPISCVQMEYSPFRLEIESPTYKLLEVARELGVAIVAYSPLGGGLLTGTIRSRDDVLKPGDARGMLSQLSEENLPKNLAIVDKISEIAKSKGATAAQLTLAWIFAQGDDFFAIPGTTKVHRLEENMGSVAISVSPEEEKAVRKLAEAGAGERFQNTTAFAFGDSPPL